MSVSVLLSETVLTIHYWTVPLSHISVCLSVCLCVQGKGTMTTYWLISKDGFNKPLPTEEMMVSASQHEFK